jgi:glycosyltransferase involved in cell wall biosynthesis
MSANYQTPRIEPVPAGRPRPTWSVMIPTFNCAQYLRQTLETVLAQDIGAEHMQIEVIDDCSTKDDPEKVVSEAGKGRISFYRRPENGGAVANFNTCIARSNGHLVHILHGDDYVGKGFYKSAERALEIRPTAGLAAVRSFLVNREGEIDFLAPRLAKDDEVSHSFPGQLYENGVFTNGVVVRRSAYEEHGGFISSLVHVADWEMWDRITHFVGGVFVNEPLGYYRLFPENDTGRLARSAENLIDCLRLADIFASRHPEFSRDTFEARIRDRAWTQYQQFYKLNDSEAKEANFRLWYRLFQKSAPLHRRIGLDVKLALKKQWNRLEAYAQAHAPETLPMLRTFKQFVESRGF